MSINGHRRRRRRGVPNANDDVAFVAINRPLLGYKHNKRKNKITFFLFPTKLSSTRTSLLLLFIINILTTSSTTTTVVVQAQKPTDNYCGPSWIEAAKTCSNPCPSKTDTECSTPGHKCFQFTGCQAKLAKTTNPPTSKRITTKKPTSKPTIRSPAAPAAPATTPKVTSPPTATPTRTRSSPNTGSPLLVNNWYPYVDTTILNGGGGFMNVKDDPSSRSYGCIFELDSTSDSPAIAIRSLEIYISYDDELFAAAATTAAAANVTAATATSNATATITYELWTRPQTWHGFEGRVRSFTQLTSGSITITNGQLSHQNEKLIAVTIDNFDPIKINGGGNDRRAIYVTLSKRNMLYQHSSEPYVEVEAISSIEEVGTTTQSVTEDTIVLASTNHLIVYEGAAVMIYPFKEAKTSIFYRYPRGFVGRIMYDREPCELVPVLDENGKGTGKLMSVQKWDECTEGTKPPRPTVKPTVWVTPGGKLPPPTTTTTTNATAAVAAGDNVDNVPILSPSSTPSISLQPSKFIMKSYLIITLNNIRQDRVMDAREQNSFEKGIVSFLNLQQAVKTNEVIIERATTWYQQTYTTEERDKAQKGEKKGSRNYSNGGGGGRVLQQGDFETAEASSGQQAGTDLIVPSLGPILEVTVIISVERSPLPRKITSQLFETMIRNSKTDFLDTFKKVDALAVLFANTNDVPTVLSVERLTRAPTLRPTRSPVVEVEIEEEEVPGFFSSALRIAIIIIGLVWVGLVVISFNKIKKARHLMKISRDRRFLGEESFMAPYHGMVYEDEKKGGNLRKSKSRSKRASSGKKGMRASLLGGFGGGGGGGGGKKSSLPSKRRNKSEGLKDSEAYSEGEDYDEKSDEIMSSIEDSSYASEEESLSVDGSRESGALN